jgi:hypothetical protein
MSREDEAKEARLFDTRTVERNIKRGLTTRKEYDKFLKALQDASDKCIVSEHPSENPAQSGSPSPDNPQPS